MFYSIVLLVIGFLMTMFYDLSLPLSISSFELVIVLCFAVAAVLAFIEYRTACRQDAEFNEVIDHYRTIHYTPKE